MGREKKMCACCGFPENDGKLHQPIKSVQARCDHRAPSAEPAPAPQHIEPPFYNAETGYVEDVTQFPAGQPTAAPEGQHMRDIGDVRRSLFLDRECKWNGVVRDVTAKLEVPGMLVDEVSVLKALATKLRNLAFAAQFASDLGHSEPSGRCPTCKSDQAEIKRCGGGLGEECPHGHDDCPDPWHGAAPEGREPLLDWLKERRDNCIRIAGRKTGDDKQGWLEDASYLEAAIREIAKS